MSFLIKPEDKHGAVKDIVMVIGSVGSVVWAGVMGWQVFAEH